MEHIAHIVGRQVGGEGNGPTQGMCSGLLVIPRPEAAVGIVGLVRP